MIIIAIVAVLAALVLLGALVALIDGWLHDGPPRLHWWERGSREASGGRGGEHGMSVLDRGFTRRERRVEAQIRSRCERGSQTIWIDAKWYEALSRERVQQIVSEYGYGELRRSR